MGITIERVLKNPDLLDKVIREWEVIQDAIRSAPVPFAVYDTDDQLIVWNPPYEELHPAAFAACRELADAGRLTYRELIRFQLDPGLSAKDAEAELNHWVQMSNQNNVTPMVREDVASGYFKIVRYRLDSGARAGFAIDINDLINTQKDLTAARVNAEKIAQRLRQAYSEIETMAFYDELTKLPNRRLLDKMLNTWSKAPDSCSRPCVVLHIDLDRFKQVNDLLGHAAGDHVLCEVAKLLVDCCREDDVAVRLGGDEFVLVMVDDCDSVSGNALGRKIIEKLRRSIYFNSTPCRIGASIGVSQHQLSEVELDVILSQTDHAMYRAKSRGRNRVEHFDISLKCDLQSRNHLVQDLLTAIEQQQFLPFYQPQFRCADNALWGVEALCRWQTGSGEILIPSDFFDTAASLMLIGDIDRCIFNKVAEDVKIMERHGALPPKLSINVGFERLFDPELASQLASLRRPGMDVAVELLESLPLEALDEELLQVLSKLKMHNILLEIDDFGSDRASINSLVSLSPSAIKIGRKVILPGPDSESMQKLIQAIVEIGSALNIPVIAEGVETARQMELVRRLGCDYMQGYALAMPMTRTALLKNLRTKRVHTAA